MKALVTVVVEIGLDEETPDQESAEAAVAAMLVNGEEINHWYIPDETVIVDGEPGER